MNSALFIVCMVAVVPTAVQSLSTADLLPHGEENGDVKSKAFDEEFSLARTFKYQNKHISQIKIWRFGIISLISLIVNSSQTDEMYIYQYYISNTGDNVYYRNTTHSTEMAQLTSQIHNASTFYRNFNAKWAMIATWREVVSRRKNNTFQTALVTNAYRNETFVILNYVKLGTDPGMMAGFYDTSPELIYALPGSDTTQQTVVLADTSNTGTPGRWIFRVSTGDIQSGREINYNCSNSCPELLKCTSKVKPDDKVDSECKCLVDLSNTCPTTTSAPPTTTPPPTTPPPTTPPPTTTPPTTTTQVLTSPPNTTLAEENKTSQQTTSTLEPTTTEMEDTCTETVDRKCVECKPGWKGDECRQRDCTHQKYCTIHTCHELGKNYNCTCNKGYRNKSPHECVDINECDEDRKLCGKHYCNNTEGTYHCTCNEGYENVGPDFCAKKMSPSSDPENFDPDKVQTFDSIQVKAVATTLSLSVIGFLVINMFWCAKTIILAILRFVLTERKPTSSYETDLLVWGTDSSEDEQENLEAMGDDIVRTLKSVHLKSGTFRKSAFQRAKSVFAQPSVDEDRDD